MYLKSATMLFFRLSENRYGLGLQNGDMSKGTVVGFKLSGHFKFFFDIINVRVTFLDAKGPIK